MFSKSQKRQRLITFIFVNTIQYPRTLKNNIYHSNNGNHHQFLIRISILGHALVHSVDKTHVLVVTVKLIGLLFLNIFSFNFAPTLNKSLRFTRFRRSYVNHTAVVLTNHCQNYTAFSSSNINEVIKTVLNFLLFFHEKILLAPKSTKTHKMHQNAPKRTKKHKNATKKKHKNADK